MNGVVLGLGQQLCSLMGTWGGTAGQCYQLSHAQSLGYAAISGLMITAAVIAFALGRRLRT